MRLDVYSWVYDGDILWVLWQQEMIVDKLWVDGWYQLGIRLPSPNFDRRPTAEPASVVVVHNISLPPFVYGGHQVQTLFTNQIQADEADVFMRSLTHLHVSSHFLLERDGVLTQFVSCDDAAYHAGVSNFRGRTGCNAFSIGIELEGCDFEPFTELQYDRLIDLLKQICRVYPIEAITGHQHIAPGRKSDPGHFFDWTCLQAAGLPVVAGID